MTKSERNSIINNLSLKVTLKIARLDGCSLNELPARLNEERTRAHSAVSFESGQKGKSKFLFFNFFKSKLLFASAILATLASLARSLMDHQLRRLSPPNGLIDMAVSDSSTINRRLSDASTVAEHQQTRNTKKRKRFLRLAGPRCPTFLCEFFIILKIFTFSGKLRRTASLAWTMEQCCCSAESTGEVTARRVEFGN
jgi:hypothetical protein